MAYVNKLKMKMNSGEVFEFELGTKTNLIDFWDEEDIIVQDISYKSIIDPTAEYIEIKACPNNLIGSVGCLNIQKSEIEYYSYSYATKLEPTK